MIAALENFRGRFSLAFEVEVIDIDQHPALERRWGDKVPVLLDAEQEICHYFLDEAALQRAGYKG
jgi:thioredoxin reductase (NADPH)